MKLEEIVENIRKLIFKSFDKRLSQLGLLANKQYKSDKILPELLDERRRIDDIMVNLIVETGDYNSAREKLIDEFAFTFFNRIAGIKVMEVKELIPEVVTRSEAHGGRSIGHKIWLENNQQNSNQQLEGLDKYIRFAFNELSSKILLYSSDFLYDMLPDVFDLNEILEKFNTINNKDWQSDDILGWLYESYNNPKKKDFKDSGDKVEYDKVSLQSQVYTPRWVVQFLVENSLGKLYLEMYPDSAIKNRYKIANAPTTQERNPKPLHEIKLIDPACGSGNFLLYAFDFFYALYIDQIENYGADYDDAEIPKLIIENNLRGIDLDDRAIQLAQLGLYIKARKKQRSIGNLKFKVVSSDFFLPDYKETRHIFEASSKINAEQRTLIADIWSDLQYAYKFGSLILLNEKLKTKLNTLEAKQKSVQPELFTAAKIMEHINFTTTFFTNLKTALEQYASEQGNTFLTSKTRDAITFLELLTTEYDVATTNPPYTDSANFGPELKTFIESNYKKPYKFHTNLYATFIKRCYEFTREDGKIAMIHPRTFMFIKTFEDVRKFMLDKTHINVFIDYSLSNLFGAIMVDPAFYVLEKNASKTRDAWFVSLDQYTRTPNEKYKKDFCLKALDDYIAGVSNEHNYSIPQSKLKIIKSCPFIYWISDEFREKFGERSIGTYFHPASGIATGNNYRFLKYWWEVDKNSISNNYLLDHKRFVPYAKGGPFKKWAGNLWLLIDWNINGDFLKSSGRAVLRNKQYYFSEGITYSLSGSKGASFRLLPKGSIFDVIGSSIFNPDQENYNYYSLLAFLNSKLSYYVLNCLNPTAATQVGDIERIPFTKPKEIIENLITELAKRNVIVTTTINSYSLCEPNFNGCVIGSSRIEIKSFFNYENHILTQVLLNEAIINGKIFEVYELIPTDKAMVLAKEGESIGGLPVSAEARNAYLAEEEATKEFPLDNIRDFIVTLPVKEFTAEEHETVEREFPSLYQNNNDLEEFCIRHQVNPINVWYWFKHCNVIPKQRMNTLAMEFLAGIIREILMEDEDGIIPLVPNAGEKILLNHIEEKFFEKGFSMAQYSSFDTVLGCPLNEYLNKYFFAELSDHLNLFMYLPKTPFIWHLSSGSEQGFDCYIIIYKWNRDKLFRLKSVYIERRERALVNRQIDLTNDDSIGAQNEKEKIKKQLKEIEVFKQKIDELLEEGYDPVLDDGVGKNIAPLQKKQMIPYEVLNEGQLKKYLNADW